MTKDSIFGDNLKKFRLSRRMTQSALAQIMSVNVVTICHWEKSKQEPCIEDIKKLCRYFDISADLLLGI